MTADAWDDQMLFLASKGYRCIAHDRRGHRRSSQPWCGNDMDIYTDDRATLTEKRDLKGALHVGHSTEGDHGMTATRKDQVNADLLAFRKD